MSRFYFSTFLCSAPLFLCSALASERTEGDVLFEFETTTYEDGREESWVAGDPWIEQADGSVFMVGPDKLTTPDGETFGVDWSIRQDEEDGPIVTSMQILVDDAIRASDELIRQRWLSANEGATDTDFDEWVRHRNSLKNQPKVTSVDNELWELAAETPNEEIRINVVFADSTEPNYWLNQDRRLVHAAVYYEDSDRDDADGPAAGIK